MNTSPKRFGEKRERERERKEEEEEELRSRCPRCPAPCSSVAATEEWLSSDSRSWYSFNRFNRWNPFEYVMISLHIDVGVYNLICNPFECVMISSHIDIGAYY
ncbi:hypothetical protein ACSBR1_006801 [Camellia fascicularis]